MLGGAVAHLGRTAGTGVTFAFLAAAVVAGAIGYVGWRRPGIAGGLLLCITPFGALVGLFGGPAAVGVFAGVPLVMGLLLIVASRARSPASQG